jgi:hypothetical protein
MVTKVIEQAIMKRIRNLLNLYLSLVSIFCCGFIMPGRELFLSIDIDNSFLFEVES